MEDMTEISDLKAGLIADIAAADTLDALEGLRVGALGKNGVVTGLLKTLGGMSPEERLEKGPPIQDLRESVTAAIAAVTASRRLWIRGPVAWRLSGDMPPSVLSSPVTAPCLPSVWTRTASSASRLSAASTEPSRSARS